MKASKYNICLPFNNNCILFNGISRRFFIISRKNKEKFLQILSTPDNYSIEFYPFIEKMRDEGFVINDSCDELNIIKQKYEQLVHSDIYILMILPTYACNVACWYCTQLHRNLHLKDEDIEKVKKHIVYQLEHNNIKGLQLSWFGGEPLIDFQHICDISVFAKKYCYDHNYKFKNIITTNGTLLTEQMLDIMTDLGFTFFQITIDGTQTEHDKVKVIKEKSAYEMTLKNICLIADKLPNAEICLRYNYTQKNLQPESFLNDLNSFLPPEVRPHISLSLMKVWQEDDDKIDLNSISFLTEEARKAGYNVKVGANFTPCYVENINYNSIFPNGLVDKCDNNDPDSCRGYIDESGVIKWNEKVTFFDYNIYNDLQSECRDCIYLPLCYGPCPREREHFYHHQQHLKCRFPDKDKKWYLDILQYCKNNIESSVTAIMLILTVILSFGVCKRSFSQNDSIKNNESIYKNVKLDEVTIKGMNCISYPEKDVWIITREMRKNTFDTFSLLQKIPGFIYDRFTKSLSYWGTENILITIDGIKKNNDYGGSLANMRFKKIEIYNNPKGQYDEYDIVINLITYEDWQGYDAMGVSITDLFPSSKHGNLLGRTIPDLFYTYTRPKFDLSSYYSYIYEDTRKAQWFEMKERDICYSSISKPSTTNTIRANKYEGFFDIDYKLNKYHTISAKYTFTDNCHHTNNYYQLNKIDEIDKNPLQISRVDHNHYDVYEHTASIFYQTRYNKWRLSSEMTYNTYSEKNKYSYSESHGYSTNSVLNNYRHSYLFLVEVDKEIKRIGNLKVGGRTFHRKYKSDNNNNSEMFDSKQSREKAYINLSRQLGQKLSGNFGLAMEFIQNESSLTKNENQAIWGGNLTLRYGQWGDKFRFELNYKNTINYPMLYQIMPILNNVDSLLIYSGNPNLKASTLHHLNFQVRYRQIGFNSTLSYSSNSILPIYKMIGNQIVRTYDNVGSFNYQLNLGYYPKDIRLKNSNIHYTIQISYGGSNMDISDTPKHVAYLTGLAQISYSHNKFGLVQLDYRRQSKKVLTSQTISRKASDGWHLLIAKDFFQSRLDCAIEYVLPLKLGVAQNSFSDTTTPYYSLYVSDNSFVTYKNRISFHLTYHIANGHKVNKKKNEQTRENEVYNNYN